jgi:hypothetical protein
MNKSYSLSSMSKPIAGILQTKAFIIIEDTQHDTRRNRNDEELPEDLGLP